MATEKRITVSVLVLPSTKKKTVDLAKLWKCSQGKAIDRAIEFAEQYAKAPEESESFTLPTNGRKIK